MMHKILIIVLLAFSIDGYSQKDSLKNLVIIDTSLNLRINYSEKWRELKTSKSISSSTAQNKYTPVIHIESNPNYQTELNSDPSVVTALIVTKDSNHDTKAVNNEDDYLKQMKVEMLQLYGHLQFEDEPNTTIIKSKELRSIKASAQIMGYSFYQEYITFLFEENYITIVLLYSSKDKRDELISLISFIENE